MATLTDSDRWFSTMDDFSVCRLGGNGEWAVTQIMPLVKYTQDGESFLDLGCGSGTTLDALHHIKRDVKYKGTDFVHHRIDWLKDHYKNHPMKPEFEVGDARKIDEEDQSWDTVYNRHVIEHTNSFNETFDEHCRVAKKRVICILFRELAEDDRGEITNIKYDGITYKDEFFNQYIRSEVLNYLKEKEKEGWKLTAFAEHCGWDMSRDEKGNDTVIILERIDG